MKNIQDTCEQNIEENSITDIFRKLNDPINYNREHSDCYLYSVQIGAVDNYCGADTIAEWYRRNICIFGNLQSIANTDDRILVIFGAGHCKILNELVSSYNNFSLINTLDYL